MATRIEVPECVRRVVAPVYPDMDLDGVRFHEGLPFYAFLGPGAITVGPNVYFRQGRFDPCSCDGIALIVHELYHIRQGADGPGFWFLRPFYLRYIWLWVRHGLARGRKHPLEEPAYKLQREVMKCCKEVAESGPCRCEEGRPVGVNEEFLKKFAAECPQPLADIE